MVGSLARIAGLTQLESRQYRILRLETQVHRQCFAQATQRDKGSRHGDAAERDRRALQSPCGYGKTTGAKTPKPSNWRG
jgi:hypothetical protein